MTDPIRYPSTPGRHARLLRYATYASVSTAGVLIAVKLVAALMTGSVSIMASLIDSMMDVLASVINLFAVHYALTPPDEEHRFGHGKAEPLAGLVQAAFISGSAVFLIVHAVDRLVHPQPIQLGAVGFAVMLFSIFATLMLLIFQHYVIRRTNSTAIRADALHYATDLLSNSATVLALCLAAFGWSLADPIFAIGIAFVILYSAIKIAYEAIQLLMDCALPDKIQDEIAEIVKRHPQVGDIHGMRTRQSGQTYFIQLHLGFDRDLSLVEALRIIHEVKVSILRKFPNADIIILQEPITNGRSPA